MSLKTQMHYRKDWCSKTFTDMSVGTLRAQNKTFTDVNVGTLRAQNSILKTSFWNYSEQLEEFIARYKTRPPDIKFWPYGPYWPKFYDSIVLETPKHIRKIPTHKEPLFRSGVQGKWR